MMLHTCKKNKNNNKNAISHLCQNTSLVDLKPIRLLLSHFVQQLFRLLVGWHFPAGIRGDINADNATRKIVGNAMGQIRDQRTDAQVEIRFGDTTNGKMKGFVDETMVTAQMGDDA